MPDPTALTWPTIITIALGSSVVGTVFGKAIDRSASRTENIRNGYADATKALNAWGQFPLRIRRRVDDDPATLARLEALGAEIQEGLAYATGWVGAESAELGRLYNQLAELLRAEVTIHARIAWATPPATTGSSMNIAGQYQPGEDPVRTGELPAEWVAVQLFSSTIQYRIGWRRYVWVRPLLHKRLARLRIAEQAAAAFTTRSARRLSTPPPATAPPRLRSTTP
jgi:hypothetical protein